MDIISLFEAYFWNVATASVALVVPIIGVILTFKILSTFILKAWD